MTKVGLSLSDYWLIIRKRKWVVISCFLGIFLSVVVHTQNQPSVYKATCSIRMIERKAISDMIVEMVSYTSYDAMSSLSKIIVGRAVIEKAVYELGLADENSSAQELEDAILSIQAATIAENEFRTNIINIIVEYGDPVMAAKIANTIAKVFIEADSNEKNERAYNMRIFVEEQFIQAQARLIKAENELKVFKEKGEATGIALTLQDNIAELQKQKIELKKVYTDKYPDVVNTEKQIKELSRQLQTLPEGEVEYARLNREMQVNEASYRNLKSKLEAARIGEAEKIEDVKVVNPAIVPKAPIRPNKQMAVTLGLVIGFVVGAFMAFIVETFDTSIGTIEDIEALLDLPVLTVIPYLKTTVKDKFYFKRMLSKIGWLPTKSEESESSVNIKRAREQLLINCSQNSSGTEAYRILRTNIKAETLLKNEERVLMVTSTIPKEGKSVTSANLSLALAQDGYKTILIDCDLRKPVLHRIFKLDKDPGLSDILLGSCKPEEGVRNFVDLMMSNSEMKDLVNVQGLDHFSLLPSGKTIFNPAELLDSADVRELIAYLKTKYDFIIIDSPPVLPVPDTIILGAKVVDRLYLLYRAGNTSKLALVRAKDQLAMTKAKLSGIILNSTTPAAQIVSNYYQHYYHYKYYSEESSGKKKPKIG